MEAAQHLNVAVLLATHNGAKFVDLQIRSLAANHAPFTLHWLDDHSTDDTRTIVQSSARRLGIYLVEWHQSRRQGLPGSFFQLLERVEADIYLFCDQDDIWLPGKIDATVANLVDDLAAPVVCFSDTLLFSEDRPGEFRCLSNASGMRSLAKTPPQHRMFEMFACAIAPGHTQGFTRPVREMFLRHKTVGYAYAFMHDWWIHDIALASGTVRTFSIAPTVLWRQHGSGFCVNFGGPNQRGIMTGWRTAQRLRQVMARHAQGLVLAAPTLLSEVTPVQLLELAKLISAIDRRQTPAALFRLLRRGAIPRLRRSAIWFSLACLCSHAAPPDQPLLLESPDSNDPVPRTFPTDFRDSI